MTSPASFAFRVAPLRKAEEERRRKEQEEAAEAFRQLLKETSDVNASSRWSKVR